MYAACNQMFVRMSGCTMRVFVAEALQTMRVMAERCAGARVCLELSARVLM